MFRRITVPLLLLLSSGVDAAGLTNVTNSGGDLLSSVVRLLNIAIMLIGSWWVLEGILRWKKSAMSDDQHVSFKSIMVPVIAGMVLVCFTGFVALTSETFGLKGMW